MAPDLADHAYAHCVAVLIQPELAEEAGREALRRGARTLTGVLAHARHVALQPSPAAGPAERAGAGQPGPAVDAGPIDLASAPLTEVARWLSATRSPIERAIVDLQGRHGIDRVRFARTLGLSPTVAATRAAAVKEAWAAALDPALLARLGPGGCAELEQVLAGRGLAQPGDRGADSCDGGAGLGTGWGEHESRSPGRGDVDRDGVGHDPASGGPEPGPGAIAATADRTAVTIEMLLAAVPAVTAHLQACRRCKDRRRAMVSVQDLVVGIPVEAAPASVRVVRRDTSRRRRAVPLPPSVAPDVARRPRRAVVAGALVGVLAVAAAGGAAIAERGHHDGQGERVRALTKLPPTNALSVDPTAILVPGGAFVVTNLSGRTLHWRAATQVPWLSLVPGSGTLGPHGRANLRASLGRSAPGGQATATVAIEGDDGSATAVSVRTTGAGLADLAASAKGCTITATAEAPQGVAGVVLHWIQRPAAGPDGALPSTTTTPTDANASTPRATVAAPPARSDEHIIAMAKGDTGYTAALPPARSPIQWWVAAADANGNEAQTARQILAPGSCG